MSKHSAAVLKQRRPPMRGAAPGNHLEVVFTEKEIRQRVRQLAKEIRRDYQGKALHVVGVLDNCLMFMADLIRALAVPAACSLISSRVRDSEAGSVAMREILYIPPVDVGGKDILLVDGIVQSGVTLDYLCRMLLAQHPASLHTAALLDRSEDRKLELPVDYVAFKVSGGFFVGYGLGKGGKYRNLPHLARLA